MRRVVAESVVGCGWDASGMCWRAFPHGDMKLHVPIKHEVRWSGKRRKQNGLDFCVDVDLIELLYAFCALVEGDVREFECWGLFYVAYCECT